MSCLYPNTWFRSLIPNEKGKRPVYWDPRKLMASEGVGPDAVVEQVLPCGRCIECRLRKSRYTAVRCVHEASMYENNSFLTLTYSDEHLPSDRSLSTRHMQLFWKKLRERSGAKFKYFAAGEYGEASGERVRYDVDGNAWPDNPHYHACVFGYDLPDKVFEFKNSNGDRLYSSAFLDDVWGLGRTLIGDVTFESAAYVARYTMKKVYGDDAQAHYMGRLPEKCWTSIGLGKSWFDVYYKNTYETDFIVTRDGVRCAPPPYYDKLLLKHDPDLYADVMFRRDKKIIKSKINVDTVYSVSNPTGMNASELVRRAQLRVGRLDQNR